MPTVLIGPGPLRNQSGAIPRDPESRRLPLHRPRRRPHLETETELRAALPEADAMVAGGERISAELLALAPRLHAIARTGVGYDAIDLAAATAKKIAVVITPGVNQESVAEQTFALLTRNIVHTTQGLINRATLAKMHPGSFLINTARGGLVSRPTWPRASTRAISPARGSMC